MTLLDGFVRDVTASINHPGSKDVRLFVCSYEGHIFTHLLTVEEPASFNGDELILVENIYIPDGIKPVNKPVSSVFYSSHSQIFVVTFEDGSNLLGKFLENEYEVINITKLTL